MKRCVIIGGAAIQNYEAVRRHLQEGDFYVFCDSGLRHQDGLQITPNLIVGDFDSHPNPHADVETIVLPTEKDDTDTMFAVKEALERGFSSFLLLGVIGARLDHTLGNLSILLKLSSLGKQAVIVDDYSQMEIVSDKPSYIDDSFAYFSILNLTGSAHGITIENAKYPLQHAELPCDYPLGVSNEVLPGKQAKVSVAEGSVLLIKVYGDELSM